MIRHAIESEFLPDGRERLFFPNLPAMSAFPHKSVWSPRDAIRMQELTTRFYKTPAALLMLAKLILVFQERRGKTTDSDEARLAGDQLRSDLLRAQSDPEFAVIFADEGFAQMMQAAALSAKGAMVSPDDIIARSGVVYFRTPQDLNYLLQVDRMPHLIRGFQWHVTNERQGPCMTWYLLVDGPDLKVEEDQRNVVLPRELYLYTVPYGLAISPLYQTDKPLPPDHLIAMALLRSITEISRSQHTRSEVINATGTKGGRDRKSGKNKGRDVRILSLHNPEYGRYELDAATGRKLRQHWVRGHWRNQWYRGEQVNKSIWIDGFVRGDAALGTVTGQKVYVARAQKHEPIDQGVAS